MGQGIGGGASGHDGGGDERGVEASGDEVEDQGDRGADVGPAGVQGAASRVHREQRQGWILEIDRRAGAGAVEGGAVERAPQALGRAAGVDGDRERADLARWRAVDDLGAERGGDGEPAGVLVEVGDSRRAEGDGESGGVQADRVRSGVAARPRAPRRQGRRPVAGRRCASRRGCCRSRWRRPAGRRRRGA